MSNEREKQQKGKHMFIARTKLGTCPCCTENVYDNQLFVEENEKTYHYSCYNMQKANEGNGK